MNLFKPKKYAYAHCDLPCGVYDPAQARINAESVVNASKKYQDSDDPAFKQRCITIKEDMAEEVKKDLWVCGQTISNQNTLKNFLMYMIFFGMQLRKLEKPRRQRILQWVRSF